MSNIEWTDATWNPVVGCTPVSPGCDLCYAGIMAHRLAAMGQAPYIGITVKRKAPTRAGGRTRAVFNGEVRTLPDRLTEPLHWRKPRRVFVNSMSDLFHEKVPFEFIDRVFAVMALCPRHTFQVLTKRPERMAEYLSCGRHIEKYNALGKLTTAEDGGRFYAAAERLKGVLPNVWLGTSAEDQERLNERMPWLFRCPAAVRFLSCEPLLGGLDFAKVPDEWDRPSGHGAPSLLADLDWVIVGGESGPGARPCNVGWIRLIVAQCKDAGVPCFVKQLGANIIDNENEEAACRCPQWTERCESNDHDRFLRLNDRKGGDMAEWSEDLRVREFPAATGGAR